MTSTTNLNHGITGIHVGPPGTLYPPKSDAERSNHILEALPIPERDRLSPHLQIVAISLGQHLCHSTFELKHVYFPISCIFFLLNTLNNGKSVGIATVGNEGMVGISSFLSDIPTPISVIAQCAGYAFRLEKDILKTEFNRSVTLQRLFLRYVTARMTEIGQMAVCNRFHSVEQQLCRWLLSSVDRLQSDKITTTHELIANNMLGVRRESVTAAARTLKEAGLIQYNRGHIRVIDRGGLELKACECYDVVKEGYGHLLSASDRK